MENILTEKVELFDGDESLFYNRQMRLSIPNLGEVEVNTNAFNSKNEISHLEPIIGHDEFLRFIQHNKFKGPVGVMVEYWGTFDLTLYFLRFGECIAVFAAGEKQPTRFMIYLEGIWKIA